MKIYNFLSKKRRRGGEGEAIECPERVGEQQTIPAGCGASINRAETLRSQAGPRGGGETGREAFGGKAATGGELVRIAGAQPGRPFLSAAWSSSSQFQRLLFRKGPWRSTALRNHFGQKSFFWGGSPSV